MGEQEDSGLTLRELAQRLETQAQRLGTQAQRLERLERENERVRSENAELREEVAALLSSSATRRAVGPAAEEESEPFESEEGRVSRRWLLSKAGAAAAGLVAAGALTQRDARPAQADMLVKDNVKYVANVANRGAVEGREFLNPLGDYGQRDQLAMRMFERRSRRLAVVLEQQDVFEAAVPL